MKKERILISFLLLLIPILNFSTTYYSRANTSWNTAATWSTAGCGGVASVTIPSAADDVIICSGYSVIINGTANCQSLTIDGTANWTSSVTLNAGTGGITINPGGNISGTSAGVLTTTGGLIINSTLTSTSVTIRTVTNPGQTITGTGTFGRLDISAETINNGTITVTTDVTSTVPSTLIQGTNASLTYNGTSAIDATLDASASGNTFTYSGAAQPVKQATYHNLVISGSGIKTMGGDITVNGDLTVNTGVLSTSTFQITGNATGIFSLDAGTTLNIGSNGSAVDVLFPTNFTTPNISLATTSTIVYYGNSSQVVSHVPVYGNLTVRTFSGVKTASGDITVNGNLMATSPTTLAMTSNTLNAAGDYTGTGSLSFTSGVFNISGNYSNTGTFTRGTGTVNYTGSTPQTIRGANYYNLTFSNVGEKLLQASATIGITGTFTRGTMLVTPGTSNNVIFNGGGVQVMTGSATTFTNLTVTNTTLIAPADFTINTTLSTSGTGLLNMDTYMLNVLGNYTGSGALSFSSGTLNISGNYSNTGTFTCGTSTVDYNGSGAQAVRGVNYYNLTFSDAGTKTLQASRTVGIAGTFTRGNMTVTPGTSNTVAFNGGVQTMTGIATNFANLTLNNTSLTAPADFNVSGTLTGTSPATLNMSSNTLNLTGSYTGTSALVFSSGVFNIAGSFTNTGTFTCGTGTVNFNGAGGQTVRGVTYHDLIFSNTGTKTLQAASTLTIGGNFTRGTMTVTPGSTNTVLFNGGAQLITGNATTFVNLSINNTSLTLGADITVNSALTFTSGHIVTNAYNVLMGNSGTVSRTSGHVIGNLRKNVAAGSNISRTFEVGTGSDYTPLDVVFTSVTTAGSLLVKSFTGDHPAIASSGFNAATTINRYWTLTNTSTVYTNYNLTTTFVNADKDPSYNTANSLIKLYNGTTWSLTNAGAQTANSAQALAVTMPATPNTVSIQIGEIVGSATGNLYSIATGNWSTPGTWSQTSGGASCSCIPTSLDNVFIENNFIVTMNGNTGAAKSLTIQTGGKATWTSALTTYIGTGGIHIAPTADITGIVAGILITSGGLSLNTTLTSTTVIIRTSGIAGQTISGTGSLARLDISAATTNNGTLTVTTALSSTVASTLTQGTGASLTYNGTTVVPTIDASSTSNTVTYGGTTQTIKSATYRNLIISGSGTKTLGGPITINGNLTVNTGTLSTSTHQITGNATGTLTLAASTILNLGLNTSTVNVLFPTNFISANISLATSSTINYYGDYSQVISHVPAYGNLTVQTFSGSKIASGNLTVNGNLVVTSPTTLVMVANTLNLTGSYTGTGSLSFTSGNFNIGGTFTNTGSFTCGTGTVTYNGNVAQAVRGVSYNNLAFSGTGSKTLQASTIISIAGNFSRGTMTVTTGSTNTVLFNGGTQVMTGNATTFINLTLNNSSLTIPASITVNGTLTFNSGNLITGTNAVVMGTSATVTRTNGHVIGNLRKSVAVGSSVTKTFEVGTGADYTPLTVIFTSVTTAGSLTASTTSGDHAAIVATGFNPTFTVNRFWTLTNTSILYNNYSVTATFVNGDKDPGYNTANSIIKVHNGTSWSTPTAGVITSNSAQATNISIPVTPNSVSIQIGDSNPSITGNLYAIANGNWTTMGTWSQTSGGGDCYCTPTSINDVIIENNFAVTMDGSSVTAHSLTVRTGGKAHWTQALTTDIGTGGINITSTGDITGTGAGILTTSGGLTLNKVLTSTSVTIKTVTTNNQAINGTGTLANLNIDVNTINNGNITLTDVLTVSGGTFSNAGTFTLKADATKYARIAQVCATCGFSGNFVIQRYLPARSRVTWANLSSPVSNSTMADWDNELFLEYPFTGFNNNTNRPKGTNVMAYNEPLANYYQLSAATPLGIGKGFEIALSNSNSLSSFSATTLTTVGLPNYGTINIPLSYTAGNGPAYPIGYSGENLIGNPFACAVSLSGITFTHALTSVDVYDNAIDNYKTLSGSDVIGPYQGFWAYAQTAGAGVVIPESAKSANSNKGVHRPNEVASYLNLTLSSADGSHTMAHTLKVASNATASDGWDENDHPFRRSLNEKAPNITAFAENIPLSISSFKNDHDLYIMPLNVYVGIGGSYRISTSGIKNIQDYSVVFLEDKFTHTFIDLINSTDYTFNAQAGNSKDRFALHFSKSKDYKPVVTPIIANDLTDEVEIIKTETGNIIMFKMTQSENVNISVLDLLGRNIMYDINAEANNQNITISLPENFRGWYLVVVQSSNGKTVKKFVHP